MWVVLGVLCALVLVLCIPVDAIVRWEDGAQVAVRWLFLRIQVLPPVQKTKKPKKQKSKAEPAQEEEKKPAKKLELSELVALVVDAVRSAGGPLRMIYRNLRIRNFVLEAAIAGEDAADTAVSFGKMQALLGTALGILQSYVRMPRPQLNLRPDFLGEQTVFTVRFCARLTPLVVLAAGLRAAGAFFWRMLRRGASKAQGASTAQEQEKKGAVRPVE